MSKPSLDSIGGWLEGRLTKFIAGDGDTSPVPQGSAPANEPGVFTHYSTISSTTTSASPSPPPSQINTHTIPAPPRRSGSAMAAHSAASPYVQIDRASSAMEYSRPDVSRSSPRPRIASAHPSTTTFAQVGSFGDVVNGYGPANGHISNYSNNTVMSESSLDTTNEESQPPAATWWGSYGEESSAPTPTATTFVRIDDAPVPSSSGFISLMDDSSFSVPPSPPVSREPSSSYEDDDEEDLGFGNSKKHETKKPDVKSDTTSESVKTVSSEQPGKHTLLSVNQGHLFIRNNLPDVKPAQGPATSSSSGSWLGRFWRRTETTTPGPIKASLGEETSFYYDKEQKRWVNKKVYISSIV
jgi:COPII coat assembly protein SEC16